MKFIKMHGLGNDYVYINCFEEAVKNPKELAVKISRPHFGVGADGLILIERSNKADCSMRIYNADGSEADICGNGLRCVGKYVYEYGIVRKPDIFVETKAGVKQLQLTIKDKTVKFIRVNMGRPEWESQKIPICSKKFPVLNLPVRVYGKKFYINAVSMGNPHAVVFEKNWNEEMLQKYGALLEMHKLFPKRSNIEFAEIIDRKHIRAGVWERGSKATLACGSGACAVLAAAVRNEYADRKAEIMMPGGSLYAEWSEKDSNIYLTGPAEIVFTGEY